MSYTAADRRYKQDNYRCIVPRGFRRPPPNIPDNILVLDRDPSPCFLCGEREGCRHRRWG